MKNNHIKNLLPFFVAIVMFFTISYIYFSPLIEGKEIQQHDKTTFLGTSKEIRDFRDKTGEEALWTNSIFGGMPSYLISTSYKANLLKKVNGLIQIGKRPASQVFLILLGAYIALIMFGVNPWLSLIGAIAIGFSSYNFIIISAGHNSKVFAIAYMAPTIASIYYTFKKKTFLGGALTALFLGLLINAGHLQITYYTFLAVLVLGIVELIYAIRVKDTSFFKKILVLVFAAILALGSNFSSLWTTYEYGKYSTRGKSELTHDADNKTTGLDKDYAMDWSYGIGETFTLLIPNFKGGASAGALGENSSTYEFFKKAQGDRYASQVIKQLPLYWGTQPFTAGPVYFGAIIIFLFVLGIFLLDKRLKWWLISITILAILLSWGQNFRFFSEIFLDYFPGYNKFRVVSMTLVIAQITVPLMAILVLKKIFEGNIEKTKVENALKYSLYIVGGITLFFTIFPGLLFDFNARIDQQYIAQGGRAFVDALQDDRKMLLRNDAFRSFVFIILAAGSVYFYLKGKLKLNYLYGLLFLLILVDLWGVDKRYLNDDNFVSKREAKEPFKMSQADKFILQDKDPNFRVFNLTVDPFNDASTAYFHKSIGGYHGAKMKRYQELIEHQISKNNMDVLNMLNTKYFIVPDNNRQPVPQRNPEALGNAWFVDNYRIVENADEEIDALSNFSPASEAIIDKRFKQFVDGKEFSKDSLSYIKLDSYKPNHLVYKAECSKEELAVFSEIYYPKGWNAFIDNEPIDYFRVNYILRAMVIPAGSHTIEFKFEPKSFYLGNKISLVSSSLLLILLLLIFGKELLSYYKNVTSK